MFGNLTGWHIVIILVVVVLLFGAPKLPGLARSVGQSMRIFRSEVRTMKDETKNVPEGPVDESGEEPVDAAEKSTEKSAASARSTTKPKT